MSCAATTLRSVSEFGLGGGTSIRLKSFPGLQKLASIASSIVLLRIICNCILTWNFPGSIGLSQARGLRGVATAMTNSRSRLPWLCLTLAPLALVAGPAFAAGEAPKGPSELLFVAQIM